jgi:hypothetical protein
MARKVPVPKPNPVKLSANRPLSPEVQAAVVNSAALENIALPPERRTGTNIQLIKTDVEGLAYVSSVNARLLERSHNTAQRVSIVFGLLTFLFFAGLVVAALLGKPVPPEARLLVVSVLAIGIALSLGFLGGTASISGKLQNIPGLSPVAFSAAGGVAVFVIVYLVGYFVYARSGDDSIVLQGTVVDANTSAGVAATVTIKTDANTFERQTTDSGDFSISDIAHLFGQEVTVSAKADNYRSASPQTVVVGSFVHRFKLEMYNCYNGLWHENYLSNGRKGNQWRFKLMGQNLHISRLDGFGTGDFRRGADGNWVGELSSGTAKATTAVVLSAPNRTCDQIFTNRPWSYARDTSE